jgi:FixJ family two-component response regulator
VITKEWFVIETSTIAVIDDDARVRLAIEDLLRSGGYHTRVFADAADFLRSPGISECDCIVSDFQMPEASGLDLLRTLRFRRIGTPVIIISALMATTVQVEMAKAGAFDFVEKPFPPETFLEAVRSAVAKSTKWNRAAASR